ncbi:uncharacterized protein LOC110181621 [Drosophila serrata]|uniref:uncharacterized protein LOC110181621 n=1 Tax=Drosophila serrata TaxID=7274 RepID=UPI000A1D05B3|nr:uncharacterized protein LOC110181621 [Drosophila serrata]
MEPRETILYTPEEIVEQTECPACGINMTSMKKPFSHAKKCFSIRRPGPVYRIFGYVECQCGLLIHDGSKAQKLHICVGKIPPYDPRVQKSASPPTIVPLPPEPEPAPAKLEPVQLLNHKTPQPQRKKWIRNFTSPIKQELDDIKSVALPRVHKPKLKSVTRVRNFDMPSRAPSNEVSVYSIIREDESISITGGLLRRVNHGTKENIFIKKHSLRLPAIKKS